MATKILLFIAELIHKSLDRKAFSSTALEILIAPDLTMRGKKDFSKRTKVSAILGY
ncbi:MULTISPECIES: hypothetical protein [unclassified Nostoc]|uniref:hypothetical protein n=1 Tax=unclassified Nostoc TaxID=2593658 RepID=UPI0013D8AC64|nr:MULTISPECIES: hypothetical protein [unclassified Nostoc]MBE8997292.1 hypothetical protein [Nostoc sp. LEGE 12447]NEU79467.1 hypothetical protein [Nostoc sp. UIC 10630]